MKTAIILIYQKNREINYSSYLSSCMSRVSSEGYTVLHSTFWNDYRFIDHRELIKRLVKSIDAIFMFVDFGLSDLMYDAVRQFYYSDESGFRFSVDLKIEVVSPDEKYSVYNILEEVSYATGIPVEVLKAKTRKREIVEARQFYFKRAKLYTKSSLALIGSLVNKDHATVMHGIKTVNNIVQVKERYEEIFEGKCPEKSLRIDRIDKSPLSNKTKALLIGCTDSKVFVNPYKDLESANNRPYHGYVPAVR